MLKDKLPIFLINTLLLHIPLLALTHRQNYRGTELQRNEYTRCAWAGGTLFPVVLYVVSVFGSSRKKVMVYILMYLEYNTVVVLC